MNKRIDELYIDYIMYGIQYKDSYYFTKHYHIATTYYIQCTYRGIQYIDNVIVPVGMHCVSAYAQGGFNVGQGYGIYVSNQEITGNFVYKKN